MKLLKKNATQVSISFGPTLYILGIRLGMKVGRASTVDLSGSRKRQGDYQNHFGYLNHVRRGPKAPLVLGGFYFFLNSRIEKKRSEINS